MNARAPRSASVADRAHRKLEELGAREFPHVSGSLARHLARTEQLLASWGNRRALCAAGLYHAVYGTDGIEGSLASLAMRSRVADVIGAEAEGLAYLFGACARDQFHPRIGTPDELRFADRFTGTEYALTPAQLRDFCELTAANELELSLASAAFRAKHRAELGELFCRMKGLISAGARDACERVIRRNGAHV